MSYNLMIVGYMCHLCVCVRI